MVERMGPRGHREHECCCQPFPIDSPCDLGKLQNLSGPPMTGDNTS